MTGNESERGEREDGPSKAEREEGGGENGEKMEVESQG